MLYYKIGYLAKYNRQQNKKKYKQVLGAYD